MKFPAILVAVALPSTEAFAQRSCAAASRQHVTQIRMGYLDDLSQELYKPVDDPDIDKTYDATKAKQEQTDRFGVGDWKDFVDFEEFDGGDGQMGVAGDGKKGLDKVRETRGRPACLFVRRRRQGRPIRGCRLDFCVSHTFFDIMRCVSQPGMVGRGHAGQVENDERQERVGDDHGIRRQAHGAGDGGHKGPAARELEQPAGAPAAAQ